MHTHKIFQVSLYHSAWHAWELDAFGSWRLHRGLLRVWQLPLTYCSTYIKKLLYYLYTWPNGSCQTISKITLDSITQIHRILVGIMFSGWPFNLIGIQRKINLCKNRSTFGEGVLEVCEKNSFGWYFFNTLTLHALKYLKVCLEIVYKNTKHSRILFKIQHTPIFKCLKYVRTNNSCHHYLKFLTKIKAMWICFLLKFPV